MNFSINWNSILKITLFEWIFTHFNIFLSQVKILDVWLCPWFSIIHNKTSIRNIRFRYFSVNFYLSFPYTKNLCLSSALLFLQTHFFLFNPWHFYLFPFPWYSWFLWFLQIASVTKQNLSPRDSNLLSWIGIIASFLYEHNLL